MRQSLYMVPILLAFPQSLPLTAPVSVDGKWTQLFGARCPEIERNIKLDWHSRGVLLATNEFELLPDGRVKMTSCTLVQFGKAKDGKFVPRIVVRSDPLLIKLDRPIATLTEIGSRRIMSCELDDGTRIEFPRTAD